MNIFFDYNRCSTFLTQESEFEYCSSSCIPPFTIQFPIFDSVSWQIRNICTKRFYPSLLFSNISISPKLMQEKRFLNIKPWLEAFVSHIESGDQKFEDALNSYIEDKGCCHGFCLTLVKLKLEAESEQSTIQQLISQMLKNHQDDVMYFQLMECLREHFSLKDYHSQQILDVIANAVPPIKKIEDFLYEENSLDDITAFLLENMELTALVRVWNTNEETGHSLLLRSSQEIQEFVFFNSADHSLYQYSNSNELIKSFIQHVISHTSVNKSGGCWRIELY